MSDPKSSYGEPVEEPRVEDDVVVRAEDSLADADAAREAVASDTHVDSADAPVETVPDTAHDTTPDSSYDEPVVMAAAPDEEPIDYSKWQDDTVEPEAATTAYVPPAEYDTAVTPSEPVAPAAVAGAGVAGAGVAGAAAVAPAAQPIFVQAPESPRPRGNRGAAGAIGLLAALSFAVLYLGAWLGFGAIDGEVTTANVGQTALNALGTWSLWVPVVTFYVAFFLLGAIINRGRWGSWVIFGLLVGAASYGGHILGQLFQAPFWSLTAREGADLVESQLLAPLAVVAFILGRELTIWFGAWVASRGKRVTELNTEAQREYERTLEAGPQLVRV
ncbi:ABC transporter [Microbacterium lacus]|uniref:ABC transporter n=1 Tax=Microbacterium lacus TaxID=415217 RepID=UPI00384D9666